MIRTLLRLFIGVCGLLALLLALRIWTQSALAAAPWKDSALGSTVLPALLTNLV